jgi:5'-nucleotidase
MSRDFLARILIVNDDGINAEGIKTLEEIAKSLSDDVWVVAPEVEQSGKGHAVTLADTLSFRKVDGCHFAVAGMPTDCVVLALHKIMKDHPPTLILSGINHGVNLAEDMTYSGTISIAMEGAICHIPSIAFSQMLDCGRQTSDFSVAKKYGKQVILSLLDKPWNSKTFFNVNFPATGKKIEGIRLTRQGFRKGSEFFVEERKDLRNRDYYWLSFKRTYDTNVINSDLEAVKKGYISVTPLRLDLTEENIMKEYGQSLDKDFK